MDRQRRDMPPTAEREGNYGGQGFYQCHWVEEASGTPQLLLEFVLNLANTLHSEHNQLRKDMPRKETEESEGAFVKSKQKLQDSPSLVQYDVEKPLFLACDVSAYG